MKKVLINVIRGFIKIPLILLFYLFMIPLIILSEMEDCGSGKGWSNNGFFWNLIKKLERRVTNAI